MSKFKSLQQIQENQEQIWKNKIMQPQPESKQKQQKKRHYLLFILISNIYLLIFFLQKTLFYPRSFIKISPSLGINTLSSLLFSSLYNDQRVKKNIKDNNKIENKILLAIYNRIIKIIIVINLFIQTFPKNKLNWMEFDLSKITLKIEGIGTKNVFSSNVDYNITYYPDEVYINGNKENMVNPRYYLNQSNNIVELIWNKTINNCSHMFYDCLDITEIDLSNFNSSQVTYMNRMFYECSSLTSINFSNFHTSRVIYIWSMFYNCSSLTSLNLSSYYTSQVTIMQYMFGHCSSLTSLDLSNFNTAKVQSMWSMFEGCVNLEYINLENFIDEQITIYDTMFYNVPKNVVICINETNNPKIISKLKENKYQN